MSATAGSNELVQRWNARLPAWTWTDPWNPRWPDVAVVTGNEAVSWIQECGVSEWIVIDGGALHSKTCKQLHATNLKLWGTYMSITIWGLRVAKDHVPRKHACLPVII